MNLKDLALKEKSRVEKLLIRMDGLKNDDNAGTLFSKRRPNGYNQFYQKNEDGKFVYINKKERGWILQQLHHRFAVESGKVLEKNLQALNVFLDDYEEYVPSEIIERLPKAYRDAWEFCEQKGLLRPGSFKKGDRPRFHGSEKTNDPAELKHCTTFGLRVRSKGEALIGEVLYYYTDAEFWYEKKLTLIDADGRPVDVYPDFTIRREAEEDIFWEHKGMFSDPEYFQMDQRKMQLYFINGIYPPRNLIATFDGPDGSTDMQSILKVFQGYFNSPPVS